MMMYRIAAQGREWVIGCVFRRHKSDRTLHREKKLHRIGDRIF